MQAIAVGILSVVLTSAAGADAPKPEGPANKLKLGPSKTVEVEPWTPPPRPTNQVPGMDGQASNAVILTPAPHGDAQPWPYGAMIRPPESLDRNVIGLGSNRLPLPDDARLPAKLSRAFDDGVGAFLEWLMTPRFVQKI